VRRLRDVDGCRPRRRRRVDEELVVRRERGVVERDLDAGLEHGTGADEGGRRDRRVRARREQRAVHVEPGLHGDLEDEQHAEDLVADARLRGPDLLCEDVAQAPEALGELVVGAGEVEDGERGGVDRRGRGDGREVREEVGLDAVGVGGLLVVLGEAPQVVLELGAEARAEGGEDAVERVGEDDGREDVAGAAGDGGQLEGVVFDLHDVAVFLAQRAVADERGEGEVEEVGEGACFGGPLVDEARPVELAQDGRDVVHEDAFEVGIFLVRANNVWCGCEGVAEGCRGSLGRGRGRLVRHMVGHGE